MDAIIAPARILARQPQHQLLDLVGNGQPPRLVLAPLAVVPFLSDQHPVPSEQGIRRDQRADFRQQLAAEHLGLNGQPPPLVVAQENALLAQLFLVHLVLGPQVVNHLLLLPMDPARDDHQQQLPGLEDQVHGSIHCRDASKSSSILPGLPPVNELSPAPDPAYGGGPELWRTASRASMSDCSAFVQLGL